MDRKDIIDRQLRTIGIDPIDPISVKDILPEWYDLVTKPFARGGVGSIYGGVRFKDDATYFRLF